MAGLLTGMLGLLIGGCEKDDAKQTNEQQVLQVLATTTHLADLAKQIGGDKIAVSSLMKPGVDPHSFRASAMTSTACTEPILSFIMVWLWKGKLLRFLKEQRNQVMPIFLPARKSLLSF